MRVIIVPDKFKGTLTARQAAEAIARGWRRARPADTLDLVPMSDGGDGFGRVMSRLLGAGERRVRTFDAARCPRRARWWWAAETRTAIVESAEIIGLARLPARRFHPFELDTGGLGNVLTRVALKSPRRCFIGVGGSATNDGGFGLARAVGWRFLASEAREIAAWPELASCRTIVRPTRSPSLGQVTVALDVQNPLLGPTGCTRVYGPQKGIRPQDFQRAETALARLSDLMNRQHARSFARTAGAGAAGGLGFGLMAFLGARPVTGFSLFARAAGLRERLRRADLVITGEGCLDRQSLMGKGVGELITLCAGAGVPCIAMAGRVELQGEARLGLADTYSVSELGGSEPALERPGFWLAKTAAKASAERAAG